MFVLAQRRAAAIALIAGVVALVAVLYQRRRWAALWFTLVGVVFGALYTAAFWNSTEGVGFGARPSRP